MNVNSKKLQESYNELLEYTLVLLKVRTLSGFMSSDLVPPNYGVMLQVSPVQASEIFHSAKSSAVAQQHEEEIDVQILGEDSIDSPLLLEQVLFYFNILSFYSCKFVVFMLTCIFCIE